MSYRTCSIDGCDNKHRSRGMCQMHYKRAGLSPRTKYRIECVTCGAEHLSERRDGKYCSEPCYHFDKWGARFSVWPKPEGVRLVAKPKPAPFREERECAWCGDAFTTTKRAQVYCSHLHKTKAIKNRRRGREYGSTSHFTWAEVMRLYVGKFNRCCAYCEQPIDGQPEPDHVVPLSKGGSNSITNILPSCSACNSDKRDLLLHEWAADRARLSKPPRVTSWAVDDVRFTHLTDALLLISPAA